MVDNTRPDIATPDVLARFREAIDLIEQYQPWRLRHLRRDVRQFRIVRFPSRGAFDPTDRAIITELTFLARRDITAAPVAASILHEGMHARIEAREVPRVARDSAREERICRRIELSFGQALPQALGAPVVERAAWALGLSDQEVAPSVDWAEARRRQEAVDREAQTAQDQLP
ncbi:MAG TPA: hypothetical protein VJ717_05140 [Gemmatimonadaceae bacterium]|nr:hypothetical protein [Gemmatimonadaceae bacterium]